MAEPTGFELSQEQRECVAVWLREKWKGATCPLCKQGKWVVGPNLVALRAVPPTSVGDLLMGGPVYPLVPISCANCANTMLVNALVIGGIVLPPEVTDAPK